MGECVIVYPLVRGIYRKLSLPSRCSCCFHERLVGSLLQTGCAAATLGGPCVRTLIPASSSHLNYRHPAVICCSWMTISSRTGTHLFSVIPDYISLSADWCTSGLWIRKIQDSYLQIYASCHQTVSVIVNISYVISIRHILLSNHKSLISVEGHLGNILTMPVPAMNSSVFILDTSFCVTDYVKMAMTLSVDLDLLDRLYTVALVLLLVSYLCFWSIKYSKEIFTTSINSLKSTNQKVTFIWSYVPLTIYLLMLCVVCVILFLQTISSPALCSICHFVSIVPYV